MLTAGRGRGAWSRTTNYRGRKAGCKQRHWLCMPLTAFKVVMSTQNPVPIDFHNPYSLLHAQHTSP